MPRSALTTLGAAVLVAAVLAGGLARVRAALALDDAPPSDEDGRSYLFSAVNLARTGTLSFDDPDNGAPAAPGARRGALLPAVIALGAGAADLPSGARAYRRVTAASGFVLALLGALLGMLAAGPLPGLAAGVVAALDPLALQHAATLNIQLFFGCLVAVAGVALLRWGAAATPANAALAGLAVGATLLARSTLAPFLLFLPAWQALARPLPRRAPLQLACFWAAAAAALLPWLARNTLLLGRLQPFEQGTLEYTLVAGAAGAVSDDVAATPGTTDDGTVSLSHETRGRRGTAAAVAEAAGRAVADPGAASAAAATRAAFWGWGLLAWIPAALLLRRARRKDAGLWALGGLAVYWNIHVFMLSSPRYFIPALAPLAALAAAGLSPRRGAPPPALGRLAAATALLPVACILLQWGVVARELAATSWAGAAERRLEEADAALDAGRSPEALAALARAEGAGLAPWQTARAARRYQRAGDPASCERVLSAVAPPLPALLQADAAVCAALAGAQGRAEVYAAAALAQSPGLLPAALTLGALQERRGARAAAARTYENALAASRLPAEDPLRRAAQAARLAALGRPVSPATTGRARAPTPR